MVEVGPAWIQMLSSLDVEYAGALRRIDANIVRDDDELLRNVARCAA